MDSDVLVTVLLVVLNRAVATDFPPRKTGIPVRLRDVAVGSVLAAPVVLKDEGFFTADSLDVAAPDVVLLS